jgi:hypothetical protein
LPPPAGYVAEEFSLGYASTAYTADCPTVDTSNVLLSGVTNSGGILVPSCPYRGTTGRG